MLIPERNRRAELPADLPPTLLVVVDTEEEFDWSRPLSRDNRAVASIADQPAAHEIFERFSLVPTYVVDHPVASDPAAIAVLGRLHEAGACSIGAHLHPWVNPPFEEAVTARNSYPGNLPPELERAKLRVLTELIANSFGKRPTVYKAGRYGVGAQTARMLVELGYRIDASVVPFTSFQADGGPDFRAAHFHPYWCDDARALLEIPLSCGFCGRLRNLGPALYPRLSGPAGMATHLPGLFARSGLLERIRLSPEGNSFEDNRRLTRSLLDQGCRVFSYTYHSPSLKPGCTPYVRDGADLARFLRSMRDYFTFFFEEVGGAAATPEAVHRAAR